MRINLKELIDQQILDVDTANSIENYYEQKYKGKPNTLLLIFAVVGALLIGVGVILIIAHNWNQLNKTIKTGLAFLPLLLAQGLVFYTLINKSNNLVWREASATALFFAVGASIALVSQIYHIVGDLESFLLTWMLLTIPLVFVLRSRAVLLFSIVGLFYYGKQVGMEYPRKFPVYYWLLMATLIPAIWQLYREKDSNNLFTFILWEFLASTTIHLANVAIDDSTPAVYFCYVSYFGILYLMGLLFRESQTSLIKNPFICIGFIGLIGFYIFTSFREIWEELLSDSFSNFGLTNGLILWVILGIIFLATLVYTWRKGIIPSRNIIAVSPLIFLVLYIIHNYSPVVSIVGVNILVFFIALYLLTEGVSNEDLRILNIGMLVLSVLIIARFFDVSIPFIVRGLTFIALGVAFFAANYFIIKKRNNEIG